MSDQQPILVERPQPGVAVLRFNRPEQLNALERGLFEAFTMSLDELDRDPDIKAIVITGTGRAFCAGHDLTELNGRVGQNIALELLQIDAEVQRLMRLQTISTPVIAAVNGPARGGGVSLAVACDLRIAASDATFGVPLVALGMSGGVAGLSWLLPRAIGAAAAADLLYTGRVIDADEALRLGMVSRVVPPEQLVDEAIAMAFALAAHSMTSLWMTKRALTGAASLGLSEAIALETSLQTVAIGASRDPLN